MSQNKIKELVNRFNELVDKYNTTDSMALKGHYAGEMAAIDFILSKSKKGAN